MEKHGRKITSRLKSNSLRNIKIYTNQYCKLSIVFKVSIIVQKWSLQKCEWIQIHPMWSTLSRLFKHETKFSNHIRAEKKSALIGPWKQESGVFNFPAQFGFPSFIQGFHTEPVPCSLNLMLSIWTSRFPYVVLGGGGGVWSVIL